MRLAEAKDGTAAGSARQRQLARSSWFAIASLYLLFAAGAMLTAYQGGIVPASKRMAHDHAEHVAGIAFESLYSLMRGGAERAQLQQAALRLEHIASGLSIDFVRGPRIIEEFGELHDSRVLKREDPNVRAAMRSGRPRATEGDGMLRIAYPALFQRQCLACHTSGVSGEVAGVVAVTYLIEPFEAPRRDTLLPLVGFFAIGFPTVMLVTHLLIRRGR